MRREDLQDLRWAEVSLADFYRAAGAREGLRGECKACNLAAKRSRYAADPQKYIEMVQRWQLANPERVRAVRRARNSRPEVKRRQRDDYYMRTYGISADDFDRLLDEQNGGCAICRARPDREASMHVDHDHESGAVRGLLCLSCNQGLGKFRDDPALLLRAIVYLRQRAGLQACG
ncbi:MAG: endonuclease VII domain-containing protein [Acidimicrobiales bacterium]